MKSVQNFIIKPLGSRYNNKLKVGDKDLIVNTDIYEHKFVNRHAKVIETPRVGETPIKKGDTVIVHHNVFRRWTDMKGVEKNSKSYYKDDMYFVFPDQVFAYKRDNKWRANDGFCFVQPLQEDNVYSINKEKDLIGILTYIDKGLINSGLQEGDLVGFKPNTEYEFTIDGKKLYRIMNHSITIKYERQGNEKEYNPSWSESC